MSILRRPARNVVVPAVFAAFFLWFYWKYVPFVPGFQALIVTAGLAVLVLGAARPASATLLFLFAFPLVNAWPYLFKIDESVPHAPAALVLFLFFALGRLAGRSLRPAPSAEPGDGRTRPPMLFLGGLAAVSAAITLWRFSGFFPFVAGRLYEFPVNVNGVSAGGARMSVLFASLNLLTGMGVFLLIRPGLRDARFRMKALAAVAAGLLAASAAGLVQKVFAPELGNTPFWSKMGQINGTFKDPNAFGAVLSLFIPLLIAAFFFESGGRKWLFGAAALFSLAVFPFIGARSPIIGLGAALVWLALSAVRSWRRSGKRIGTAAFAGIILAVAVLAGWGGAAAGRSRLFGRLAANFSGLIRGRGLVEVSPERYFLWREAAAMMRDHPLSGVGVGSFIVELPNYYSRETGISAPVVEGWKRIDSAENLPLQAGAELGLAGIIGLAWLAAAIAACGRRAVRPPSGGEPASGPPDRILFVGAGAGLLSFALNALFHSYIGSFETAYSFWFLAAFLSSADASAQARPPGKRRVPVLASLGVLVFAAFLAWDSGRSLSPGARWSAYPIRREFGLYPPETTAEGKAFRWTRAYGAFPLPPSAVRIAVPLHAAHPDIASRPVEVELTLVEGFFRSEVRLARVRLGDDAWTTAEVPLPSAAGNDAFLLVTVSRTWIPLKVTGAPDPRTLGVAVGALAFR